MKRNAHVVLVLIIIVGLAQPAIAISISGVGFINNSPGNQVIAAAARTREFGTANIGTSSVTTNATSSTFSNHFSWMMGHRVDPGGGNFALIYQKPMAYELSFTVNDPTNHGYVLDIDHNIRGYVTISREAAITASGSEGVMVGSLDDGSGFANQAGLSVFGGGLTVSGSDPTAFQNQLVSHANSFTSGAYSGTRNFTVRFSTGPSPIASTIFQNFGRGEADIRFGLPPTQASLIHAGYPGLDNEPASNLGHFVTMKATFDPIAAAVVPEPSSFILLASGVLGGVLRRRKK